MLATQKLISFGLTTLTNRQLELGMRPVL